MSSRLVTLATFDTVPEAHLALNALTDAGIRADLNDENVVGNLWHVANAVSGIKLVVHEQDVERAMAVIAQLPSVNVGSETPISEEELTRQALAEAADPDDPPPVDEPAEPESSPPAETVAEPIDREKAAWRAFVIGWLGVGICPLAFLALYFLLQAAFGTGPPLSRLGRIRLFVAACTVALGLVMASVFVGMFR